MSPARQSPEERLAQALRDNLRRRKAAVRKAAAKPRGDMQASSAPELKDPKGKAKARPQT